MDLLCRYGEIPTMPLVNQQLIADRLNISRTTVSRCFTNHKGINPATRSEVFELAAKLGYRYLQPRSGVKTGPKTCSIAVLISREIDEPTTAGDLLPGITEFAHLHHWQTEVHFVSPHAQRIDDPTYSRIVGLKSRTLSGLILMHSFSPTIIGELSVAFPCVSLVEQYGDVALDCVDVNHHRGIAALMARFRKNGHTRIGFFARREGVAYHRFGAYVANLARQQMSCDEANVVHFDVESKGHEQVAHRIKAGVTAWVCASDRQAYDLIAALRERGFDVPRDVSVSGFDGISRPEGAPLLDTVHIPYYEIGFAGSRRLFDKINKRFDSSQEILLDGRIQEGETIGPCRV